MVREDKYSSEKQLCSILCGNMIKYETQKHQKQVCM
jgi:hypothetical protein